MEELPYASRLNRLLGQILDGLVAAAPFIVAAIFASMNRFVGIVFMLAAAGWSFFYYFFSDGFSGGQSYGKRALGMHVIDAKTGATWPRARSSSPRIPESFGVPGRP